MSLLPAVLEGFGSGLALPLSGEPLFFALQAFGAPAGELWPVALAATLGFTLAQGMNWGVGRVLLRLRARHAARFYVGDAEYALARRVFFFLLPLLLFAWYSLGGILVVAAGFLRMPLVLTLALAAAGKAGYFAYHLL